MERYINQLIEDIDEIARNATAKINANNLFNSTNGDNEFDPSIVERYIYSEGEQIEKIVGLPQQMLPPPERLTDVQKERLVEQLLGLMELFNFHLDYPASLPKYHLYGFVWNLWKEKHVYMETGNYHIEMCVYDKEYCQFSDICSDCKDFKDEILKANNSERDEDLEPEFE